MLTSKVWSDMAGHVVIAIHRVYSLETNRVGPIPRQNLSLIRVGLQCVIVVFPDHTHLIFSYSSIFLIKGIYLSKALTCMKIFLYKQ